MAGGRHPHGVEIGIVSRSWSMINKIDNQSNHDHARYSLCPSEKSNFFLNSHNKGYASSISTFDSSPESSEKDDSSYIWFS